MLPRPSYSYRTPLAILVGLTAAAILSSGQFAEAQSSQTPHQVTPSTFSTYFDVDATTGVATLKDAYKSDAMLVFGAGEYRNAMHIEGATNVALRARNAPDSASAAILRPRQIVEGLDGSNRDAVFAVTDSTNVTLDRFNFAFDCVYDAPPTAGALWAIFFEDSSGVISNNLLLDMLHLTRGVYQSTRTSTECGGTIGSSAAASAYRIIRVQTSSSYAPDIDEAGMVTNRLPIRITGNQIDASAEVRIGIHVNGYVDATVSDNVVNNATNGVDLQGASGGVVSDNKITKVSAGIVFYPNWFVPNSPDGETVEANLEIRGNDISQASPAGISIGLGWCASADGTKVNTNVKIIGNHIHGHDDDPEAPVSSSIQIASCSGPEDERIKADIIGNTLEGSSRSLGIFAAPSFNSGTSATTWFEVNAKYNAITGHAVGARITNQNAGSTFGVARARLYATHNYWGTGTSRPHEFIEDIIDMSDKAGISFDPWLPNTDLAGHTSAYGRGVRELSDLSELPSFFVQREAADLIEAQRSSFDLKLAAEPARDLRVRFGSDNPDLSFEPVSATFTEGDWNTWQTVTVSVARDDDVEDEVTAVWGVSDDGVLSGALHPFFNTRVADAKLRGAQHLINRLDPTVSQFTLSGGDTVRIGIVPYGRQDIVDDALIDGKTDVVWTVEGGGGKFREAEPSLDSDGDPDDRVILFTAPETPGTYTIHATLTSCGIDTLTDCRATFTAKVRRPSLAPGPTPAPKNPVGEIPSVLADAEGRQYEVFTPEDGGSFDGDDVTLSADPGVVPNLEIVGVRVDASGPASNAGMTAHRYTLVGDAYDVLAVDADGAARTSYVLNSPVEVCVPLPPAARHDISDIALVADNPDGTLTVLSASVRITGSPSVNVCGNLGTLPATIAVSTAGSPDAIPTATPDPDEIAEPDTGGYAPVGNALMLLVMMGAVVILGGLWLSMGARRSPSP